MVVRLQAVVDGEPDSPPWGHLRVASRFLDTAHTRPDDPTWTRMWVIAAHLQLCYAAVSDLPPQMHRPVSRTLLDLAANEEELPQPSQLRQALLTALGPPDDTTSPPSGRDLDSGTGCHDTIASTHGDDPGGAPADPPPAHPAGRGAPRLDEAPAGPDDTAMDMPGKDPPVHQKSARKTSADDVRAIDGLPDAAARAEHLHPDADPPRVPRKPDDEEVEVETVTGSVYRITGATITRTSPAGRLRGDDHPVAGTVLGPVRLGESMSLFLDLAEHWEPQSQGAQPSSTFRLTSAVTRITRAGRDLQAWAEQTEPAPTVITVRADERRGWSDPHGPAAGAAGPAAGPSIRGGATGGAGTPPVGS